MSEPIIPVQTGLYIDGAYRAASDGAELEVFDPASEEVIASVASASIEDGLAAVGSAYRALPSWAATAPRRRAEILRKAFELMTERAEDFARLMSQENGKALKDARSEAAYAAEFFRWYSEEAVRNISEISTNPAGTNRILVLQQPVGVSILVTPWNFPAAMATRKIGPALAAGCTVILKPASETPLTALAIASLLEDAGVPAGVVNVIPSHRSSKVVGAIINDPRVRKLSFTGSTQVGSVLLREAASTIVNCSMELGGNAPFIVFDDADVDDAVKGAMIAKMRNGGEACTAANRFYVQDGIADAFTRKFATAMQAMRVGPGLEAGVDLGPLVNKSAQNNMISFVDDATRKGARIVTGGHRPDRKGFFFEPTLLTDVPDNANLLNDEIFGPIAPVQRFSSTEEAITKANSTPYGLIAYIFTGNLAKGLAVAERIESGMVGLNRGVVSDPAAPFGGVKQSGIGREGAQEGMLEFLEKKYIAVEW
jgi:succinate-semialdehyde dehydrogenase/glutarate-semialdehyde dehydrogenase